jgi:hypothetical protein
VLVEEREWSTVDLIENDLDERRGSLLIRHAALAVGATAVGVRRRR